MSFANSKHERFWQQTQKLMAGGQPAGALSISNDAAIFAVCTHTQAAQ